MKINPMQCSLILVLGLVLTVSACTPHQVDMQATDTPSPVSTMKASDAASPDPIFTSAPFATATPPLMDVLYVNSVLEEGLEYSNQEFNEQMGLISSAYEGMQQNKPTTLKIKVQHLSGEYESGCFSPLSVIVYGVLRNNPESVFPASLRNIEVECLGQDSKVLLSYDVAFADAVNFAAANEIDAEKISVIENNTSQPTPTVGPTRTPSPTRTRAPQPTQIQPALPTVSSGASAVCEDGTYSYSKRRAGTCAGHGGVRTWLKNLPP